MNNDDHVEVIDDREQQNDINDGGDDQNGKEDRGDDLGGEMYDADIVAALAGQSEQAPQKAVDNNPLIPRERYNKVNEELKSVKQQLDELLKRQPASEVTSSEQVTEDSPFDFDAAEEQYMAALLEGETARAKEIRKEIRVHEQALFSSHVDQNIKNEAVQRTVEQSLSAIVTDAYNNYPELNPDSPTFSQSLVNKINMMQGAYIKNGQRPDVALQSALADFMPAVKQVDTAGKDVAAMRRNADAASRQPPAMQTGIGDRSREATADVAKMSEEDFAALPEKEKRRLRGD